MKDQEKILFANAILNLLSDFDNEKAKPMQLVGSLKKPQGIKGFQRCEAGHPVFEHNDRYVLVMTTISGKDSAVVPYYKETLKPHTDFTDNVIKSLATA